MLLYPRWLILYCALALYAPLAPGAATAAFEAAQVAASEGRYDDVVELLTAALDNEDLDAPDQAVAYANRGIAYSLLDAYERARRDLRAAVDLDPNHSLALNHLGLMAERVDDDARAAYEFYQRAADVGFAPAQVNLADLYRSGKGVERDIDAAARLYQAAAKQGYALAYVPLGRLYMTGNGAVQNRRFALELFRQAAGADVLEAKFELGLAYEQGKGVEPDDREAAAWYRKAAMQGHRQAQNRLGYLYRRGAGVAQDFLEAAKWYRLAADQGHVEAMNRLAWLLATCPTRAVCNGEAAVELARQALEIESSASTLDTLAAAQARLGNFDAAVTTMRRVIDRLDANAADLPGYRRRLARYEAGKPFSL